MPALTLHKCKQPPGVTFHADLVRLGAFSLKNYPCRRQFSSQIFLPLFEALKLMKLLTFFKWLSWQLKDRDLSLRNLLASLFHGHVGSALLTFLKGWESGAQFHLQQGISGWILNVQVVRSAQRGYFSWSGAFWMQKYFIGGWTLRAQGQGLLLFVSAWVLASGTGPGVQVVKVRMVRVIVGSS